MKCIMLNCQKLDFEDSNDLGKRVRGINLSYAFDLEERGIQVFKHFIPEMKKNQFNPEYDLILDIDMPCIAEIDFRLGTKNGSMISIPYNFKFIEFINLGV